MNWNRGLFRFWLVVAICWIITAGYVTWDHRGTRVPLNDLGAFAFIVGPPIGLLLIGCSVVGIWYVVRWIGRGFDRD